MKKSIEHVVLALIEPPTSLASRTLTTAGIDLRAAREAIRRMAGAEIAAATSRR